MQDTTTMHDVWTYRDQSELGSNVMETHADLTGFSVEALDGSIGKVDEATFEVGQSFVVVDTGPWIFGKKVLLPAGVVRGIDETDERVYVNRTKDQIKHAPEYDESLVGDDSYRTSSGRTTAPGGAATATGTTPSRRARHIGGRGALLRAGLREPYSVCAGARIVVRSTIPSPSPSVKNARANGDACVRSSTCVQSTCSRTARAISRIAR